MEENSKKGKQQFTRKPSREIRFRTSKDGKYVMVDIIETWFFSPRYIAKIAQNAEPKSDKDVATTDG